MLKLKAKADTAAVAKMLKAAEKQVLFAQALALNDVAFNILKAERRNIVSTFKNPRPFTVNNNFVTKATKANPVAVIGAKPIADKYLTPYEFGGDHWLPSRPGLGGSNVLLVPVNAKVDAYGQLPSGNALAKMLARPDVFVGVVKGVLGVWQRLPSQAQAAKAARAKGARGPKATPNPPSHEPRLKLLILIEENKPVRKHLNFERIGEAMFEDLYPDAFAKAFARAMATAKP